jgi:hypothetical protein
VLTEYITDLQIPKQDNEMLICRVVSDSDWTRRHRNTLDRWMDFQQPEPMQADVGRGRGGGCKADTRGLFLEVDHSKLCNGDME